MKVAIIKYNAGNIGSVGNALRRMGVKFSITDEPEEIIHADKVIFPGVGEASSTMKYLEEKGLDDLISKLDQPVLGICLGMQLMCSSSDEGQTQGIGIFPESVKLFEIEEKVPHMGWNSIDLPQHPIFKGLPEPAWFYFVHSYYAEMGPSCLAASSHGIQFAACLARDNFHAVQFHPEKSGETGHFFLKNFIEI